MCEDPRFYPQLSSWEDSSQNNLAAKTPPKTSVFPPKRDYFFNRKYICTNHFFFRGKFVSFRGTLKVEIDTFLKTNSQFTPEIHGWKIKFMSFLWFGLFSVAYFAVRFRECLAVKIQGCRAAAFCEPKKNWWSLLDWSGHLEPLESFGGGSP